MLKKKAHSRINWDFGDRAVIWASLAYGVTLALPGNLLSISKSTSVLQDIFGSDIPYAIIMLAAGLIHFYACFLRTGSTRRIIALSLSMLVWGVTLAGYVAGYPKTGAWGATGGILIVYVHLIRFEILAGGNRRK